ncbi:hypothetical protein [Dubosiella newyorkensis]|uniref:hypothetical protein n=1 Tax=Dubosiella newyorkensis TaxID=1862672 RepID=UPI003F6711F1
MAFSDMIVVDEGWQSATDWKPKKCTIISDHLFVAKFSWLLLQSTCVEGAILRMDYGSARKSCFDLMPTEDRL